MTQLQLHSGLHCPKQRAAPPQSSTIENISFKQYVKQLIILHLVNQADKLFPKIVIKKLKPK